MENARGTLWFSPRPFGPRPQSPHPWLEKSTLGEYKRVATIPVRTQHAVRVVGTLTLKFTQGPEDPEQPAELRGRRAESEG